MGLLARLFGRSAPAETRDAGFYGLSHSLGHQYEHGGSNTAENLAAVAACVRVTASSMSTLPATLMVDGQPAPASASAWRWLRRPNPRMSWPELMSWSSRQLLLTGNALLKLEVDGRGAVSGLTGVPWHWVSPTIVSAGGETVLAFDCWPRFQEMELLGLPRRLLPADVLHLKLDSEAGIIGRSVLSRARGPVREGHSIETLAAANWRNGMRPSGVLSLPNYLDDNRRKRFENEWLPGFAGALNAGKVPTLEGGWKFETLSLSSVDAEFLASRAWNAEQIAALFGVPPVLLHMGQRLPTDMQPFISQFAQLSLAPLVVAIEAEFATILPDGMCLSIDLDGLQRGSFSAVVAALCALQQSGSLSANDVRAELNWPPIEGGDTLRPGNAPSWPADATGMPHLGPSPGPTGAGVPEPGTNANEGAGG